MPAWRCQGKVDGLQRQLHRQLQPAFEHQDQHHHYHFLLTSIQLAGHATTWARTCQSKVFRIQCFITSAMSWLWNSVAASMATRPLRLKTGIDLFTGGNLQVLGLHSPCIRQATFISNSTTYGRKPVKSIIEAKATSPQPKVKPEVRQLEVDGDSAGQRLDNFLLRHLKGVPKTHVYRIIRSGEVRVNKGRAAADTRVEAGDVVRVPPVRQPERVVLADTAPAPAREFPVLLEDEHLMALDKPASVAVHGGSGVSFGVIEQLRQARPQSRFLELVHRLDRETSGVLLVAKRRSALNHLQEQFRDRETGKTYLALVLGEWPDKLKVIDLPLRKYLLANGERRVRAVAKDDPEGMRSITLVKVRERLQDMTLLEVTIKTGRTHQIRVHLSAQGHPIAGDDKYGDFERNKALHKQGLKRMFLHAWRLQFNHPATGERVQVLAPLPSDLQVYQHLKPLSVAALPHTP
jgi:23S rRNA pseudouridine955/2504/2580 synthase